MRKMAIVMATLLSTIGAVSAARATPVTYSFTGGSAKVTATYNSGTIANQTIALTGTQVVFDNAGTGSLLSFQFDRAGSTGPLALTGILTGAFINLTNVSILPGTGYTNIANSGGPSTYNYTVGPVNATGSAQFTGTVSTGVLPFSQVNPTLGGQVQLSGPAQLSLNGITLGILNLPASGAFPGGAVTLKADLVFTGVPEPGTALLVGSGLLGIIASTRRRVRV
jgi:hypothetical protein